MFIPLQPRRGTIFDRKLKPLAISLPVHSVCANPKEIEEPITISKQLSRVLDIDKEKLLEKFSQDRYFVWLARHLPEDIARKIKELNFRGLYLIKENKRYYPNGSLASHLLGFTGIDEQGLEGIELYYEDVLRGRTGYCLTIKDAKKRRLTFLDYDLLPPLDGNNLVLNIDLVIQHIAEIELEKAYRKFHAKSASIIVMNPNTGEILSLANRPTYTPEQFHKFEPHAFRNRAITDTFEPGSTFKIVTASAALDTKVVDLEDRLFCENGAFKIAKHVLHDYRPHGWLTFREVIEQSSNIGTVKVGQNLGRSNLYNYIRLFGFGSTTGIDLPGEAPGFIRAPSQWSKTSIAAIPMGQEITVTALQLVCAISVIANGGYLVRPFLVREIKDAKGITIKRFSPQRIRRVISETTASKMKEILVGVVKRGTGQKAKLASFQAAGKTGTAQKVENKTYSHRKFIASFVGFAPAEEPILAISVVIDEPRPAYFGGVVAAPVFRSVASGILNYLQSEEIKLAKSGNYKRDLK